MSTDMLVRSLEKATKEEASLLGKLESASDSLTLSEAQFHATGTDKDLDCVQRDRLRVERAKKLHTEAVAVREVAQAKVDAADLARAREQHAQDLLSLPHFPESLASLHEKLTDLDRQVYDLLAEYDRHVEAGQVEWDRAAATAARVNSHLGSIPRPNLADAVLAAQIAATTAREEDERDQVDDLLSTPPCHGDWRAAKLSAKERAAHVASIKQKEADALREEGARALIAQVMSAPKPEPQTDETTEPNEAAE